MQQKKFKIAYVATLFGHLEAFHIPYMNMLKERGYEVHAYASEDYGFNAINTHVECFKIPFKKNPIHPNNFKALKLLIEHFKREKYDMVHFHMPVASVIGRIAARIAKIPVVLYTAHGFHFCNGAPVKDWLLYYPVERFMARWTDYLITINQEDFKRAQKFKVRKKCLYIPGIGVESTLIKNQDNKALRTIKRKELGLKETDFVLFCAAELRTLKNQRQMIESIPKIKQFCPDIQCVLAGQGDQQQEYEMLAAALHVERHIKFLGFRRDIPELLACSDIVFLLSTREGLPKALLEAMSASKPIVATNIRGNQDLVEDGENGYIVELHDVAATVRAVEDLYQNPSLLEKMGESSLRKVGQYDLQVILNEMEQIYENALQEAFMHKGLLIKNELNKGVVDS
ncbi:glycosyltransferase family 4 protein [Paenibacillus sp. GbtcB18]|uniref:glycosyltransferase family 4 protein n=1 Tax=Paenibacillus sp. GbtcB18 TaxID=2824763 RepID=UPI001C30A561|nr:glycosyltransferase family 4 protein [Paenibacillus sp. GbtcB18]